MSTPPHDNSPQWGNPGQDPQGQSPAGGPYDGGAGANPYGQPAGVPPEQQPGGKFGTASYNPNAYGGPIEEPDKYRKLKLFTLISLGLYVISQAVGLILVASEGYRQQMIDDTIAQQEALGMPMTAEEAEGVIGLITTVTLVFALIGAAIYLLVYFGLRANKNWARITGIVFAIIGTVFTAGSLLFGNLDVFTLILTLLWIVANIYWLVLAFSGDNARYLQQFKS